MKLSIVIPHFNSASLLRKLLESIFCENETSEVIVVDDNSTEDLLAYDSLKSDYQGKVIFLINDSGTKGPGATRNVGLSRATGDWVIFADSDDYFTEGWYKTVESFFEKDYDVVYFNPRSEDITTGKSGNRTVLYSRYVKEYCASKDKDSEKYLRYFFVVPWSKLIRMSLIRENDIEFERIMYSEDVMFSVKVGTFARKIAAEDCCIYCVTERGNSLSTHRSVSAANTQFEVLARRNLFLREHLCKEDYSFFKLRMNLTSRAKEAYRGENILSRCVKRLAVYKNYKVPFGFCYLYELKCRIIRKMRPNRR